MSDITMDCDKCKEFQYMKGRKDAEKRFVDERVKLLNSVKTSYEAGRADAIDEFSRILCNEFASMAFKDKSLVEIHQMIHNKVIELEEMVKDDYTTDYPQCKLMKERIWDAIRPQGNPNTLLKMKLYVVTGETYYEGYGSYPAIFGVYTDKNAAECARDIKIKELYQKEQKNGYSELESIDDIEVEVTEIESDMFLDDFQIGGYAE